MANRRIQEAYNSGYELGVKRAFNAIISEIGEITPEIVAAAESWFITPEQLEEWQGIPYEKLMWGADASGTEQGA